MANIGKYKIIEELGQGAMGKVYKAHDPQIDREVAIKLISENMEFQPQIKERFKREARSAGKLSHENITIVFDFGEIDDRPFIVMEYLEGTELRDLIDKDDSLSLQDKLGVAVQICNGLKYAHSKDVVHRDIKPENITVLKDGKVKIMDFGIAKLDTKTYTQVGVSMGTPFYMSPEQIIGAKVDKRADIFSFGILLYELLTKERVFNGETVEALFYCIRNEAPAIRISGTDYDQELIQVISKCLEKDPDDRYSDFSEVIKALNKILYKQPIIESPSDGNKSKTMTYYYAPKPAFLRPIIVLPLLFVIIFAGIGGWIYFSKPDIDFGQLLSFANSKDLSQEASPKNETGDIINERNLVKEDSIANNVIKSDAENLESQGIAPPPKDEIDTPVITEQKRTQTANPLLAQIDRVKREIANAKLGVPGDITEKQADSNFSKGTTSENRGDTLFKSGNLQGSLNAYRDAAALFKKARISIVDSQKSTADGLKSAMLSTKKQISTEGTTEQKYQDGLKAEADAEAAYNQQKYATAAQLYQSASMLYTNANMDLMTRKAAEMDRRNRIEAAIQTVLDEYEKSIESGSLNNLKALYRNFTADEEKKWSAMFKFSKSRKVNIGMERKTVENDRANLDLVVRVRFKDNKNREQDLAYNYTWTLQQFSNKWLISDFVARQ